MPTAWDGKMNRLSVPAAHMRRILVNNIRLAGHTHASSRLHENCVHKCLDGIFSAADPSVVARCHHVHVQPAVGAVRRAHYALLLSVFGK